MATRQQDGRSLPADLRDAPARNKLRNGSCAWETFESAGLCPFLFRFANLRTAATFLFGDK
ncbi:hypothetical protein DYL61_13450 [Pseudomonas nabeulensis]|uniref:Uncharacterized protein n=1 Tax=Pseudomonas nabeulensis TaxID=2293833 RepID=A0A4Z0B5P2_9PSED|nr:hypothetical protein DYL61_13450 [Pseudomonas nabeulensis]